MSLLQWIRGRVCGPSRDIYREALAATDETTVKMRSLRQQLEPYKLEHDPFAAIIRNHIEVEIFERPQIARMFRGPRD